MSSIDSKQEAVRSTVISIFGNALLAIVKGITGILGNSYALVADAIESTTDVFASLLVLFGLRYSTKPPDDNHPYGHGKAEPLLTFVVVGFLVISAFGIAYKSIVNIGEEHEGPKPYTLIVLVIIVAVKELLYRYVKRVGDQTQSNLVKADAWHHRSDAITSILAFIGISIALLFGKGYEAADDVAALFASVFIIYNAYLIFRPALGEVMDEHFHDDIIAEVREMALIVEGVKGTDKCFVRKSGFQYHVDLHLEVDGAISVKEGHRIAHELKALIIKSRPEISDVLIHVEPH